MSKCRGCGVLLQDSSPLELGYTMDIQSHLCDIRIGKQLNNISAGHRPAKDFDGDSTYIWKVTESRGS